MPNGQDIFGRPRRRTLFPWEIEGIPMGATSYLDAPGRGVPAPVVQDEPQLAPAPQLGPVGQYRQANPPPEFMAPAPMGRGRAALGALATFAAGIGSPEAGARVGQQVFHGPYERARQKYQQDVSQYQTGLEGAYRQAGEGRARAGETRAQEVHERRMLAPAPESPEASFNRRLQEAGQLGLQPGSPEHNAYMAGRNLGFRPQAPSTAGTGRTEVVRGRLKQFNPGTGFYDIDLGPAPEEKTGGSFQPIYDTKGNVTSYYNPKTRETSPAPAGGAGMGKQGRDAIRKVREVSEDSERRLAQMEEALTNPNPQNDVLLLFNHMGMTLGAQKGARMTVAMIEHAIKSRSVPQDLLALYQKTVNGQSLTPQQRLQMVNLARELHQLNLKRMDEEMQYYGAGQAGGPQQRPRATNPQTGETMEWDGEKWVPVRQ